MKFFVLSGLLLACCRLAAQPIDSVPAMHNDTSVAPPTYKRHGALLNDDPVYNKRSPVWQPALRVVTTNVFNWAINRYYFKVEWTASGIQDWKNNFREGPEWDKDGFGTNFIGHPHTGSNYFNVARSNGYSFWQSLPFVLAGSQMWEWLGENERPSYNDMIATPVGGMHLGEVLYRVTSNILNDSKRGRSRLWREALTAAINPTRSLNRLTSGKMFRVTDKEVYQKEPMHLTLTTGIHRSNAFEEGGVFSSGRTRYIANLQIDYGDVFEPVRKKPFDFFRFRIEMRTGAGEKKLSIVESYGLLAGKILRGNRLYGGIFQHFDYWRSNSFQLGSVGYGAGLINKVSIGKRSSWYSTYHLNAVPLVAYHVIGSFDDKMVRAYNFSGGVEAKLEQDLNIAERFRIGFNAYVYLVGVYKGVSSTGFLQIFKPYATIALSKMLRIGFEHQVFNDNRYRKGAEYHRSRSEQRFFLQFFFADDRR